jgi:hypothetical protein
MESILGLPENIMEDTHAEYPADECKATGNLA